MPHVFQRIVQVRAGPPGEPGRMFGNPDGGGSGLHVQFNTNAGDTGRPAECTLTLFNLSPESVGLLEARTNVVQLRVGHENHGIQTIFVGNPAPETLVVNKQGGDWLTRVVIRDGGYAYDHSRLNISLAGQTTGRQVLDAILAATGLGEGQVDLGTVRWPNRYVFSGKARDALDDLVEAIGPTYRWFIRKGDVYILDRTQTTPETAPRFASELGNLVGSPEPVEGGGIKFTGILDAGVGVGQVVRVESSRISGWYKVVEVNFSGDNMGGAFYVIPKCVKYRTVED